MSKEMIAREIRRAMLDNPTDGTFVERSEARDKIAAATADAILAALAGMAWWNALSDEQRAYWANRVNTGRAVDAWGAYKATQQNGVREATIEECAQAMYDEGPFNDPPWDQLPDSWRQLWVKCAQAGIAKYLGAPEQGVKP